MRVLLATAAAIVLAAHGPALAYDVYHSSADDGTPGPTCIPIAAGNYVLNLWTDNSPNAATQPAAAVCDGTGGTTPGDEICMIHLLIEADPNVSIVSFVPDGVADIVHNTQGGPGGSVNLNGLNPIDPTPGPYRIGQLTVSASGAGDLNVNGVQWVDTLLSANDASLGAPLASADVDTDADTLCDTLDPCDQFANTLPLSSQPDGDGDGIPGECQCGDFNGDGALTATDIGGVAQCANGVVACNLDLVDVGIAPLQGNGAVTATDIGRVAQAANGNVATHSLTCVRRPGGSLP